VEFFVDNIVLMIAAFVSGALLVWPLVVKNTLAKEINTLAATQLLNSRDAVMVDIREPSEHSRGVIPQARLIPMSEMESKSAGLLKECESGKGGAKPVILVCASGRRSNSMGRQLRKQGFPEVYSLEGGIDAWKQAGLPISSKVKT
jgi:rhodanese-related sulfurtransferase